VTDLRDQLADFEDAARRLADNPPTVITLTRRVHRYGPLIRRLRHTAGLTLDQVAARCHITRKGQCNRELHENAMSAGALIEALDALGYDVIAVQRLTPDRRTAV
jgi:capsular polysaccharide biosynthesis protein